MPIELEVISGADQGRKATASQDAALRVGRGETAELALTTDPLVSLEHFVLSWRDRAWIVTDRNSRLGTFVNGQRVAQGEVRDGDVLQAGQTRFRVRLVAESGVSVATACKPLFREDWVPVVAAGLRAQSESVFALLDAARDPHVLGLLLVEDVEYQSLYEGAQGEALADFAPYLAELPVAAPLTDVLTRDGWGRSWGVFLTSAKPFAEVRRHFRRFLTVQSPDGEPMLFRFYDPRVLRVFLRHCNGEDATTFFGLVTSYFIEGEVPGTVLRFTPDESGATEEVIELGPCVDARSDAPWAQAILKGCSDLSAEDRLDLLHGWAQALER